MSRRRIAVVTADLLSERMAGPAIRAFNMADQLAGDHEVTLISTALCTLPSGRFRCVQARGRRLRSAVADAEVVIFQGYVSYQAPWLMRTDKILVVDLYDPIHFEQLEQRRYDQPAEQWLSVDTAVHALNEQIVRGDFFLCANEEQRHLWLGHLAAFGRVNPATYEQDTALDSLITICPFGLPALPPLRTGPAIRGVVPGIGADDKVVLWAGGVYNWFDPLSLVAAVDLVRVEHPDIRLYFLGMKHPNPEVPDMRVAWQTRQLAEELGLTGTHVFFNDGWVDYDDRQNYLLDADAGVSTHFQHLETTFSFRTRILDYLWAGLPVIATGGDSFGALVGLQGLGVEVPERDVGAIAAALTSVLYDHEFAARCRANIERTREQYTWPVALGPLVSFCSRAERAADANYDLRRFVRLPIAPRRIPMRRAWHAFSIARAGGVDLFADRLRSYVARAARAARASRRND